MSVLLKHRRLYVISGDHDWCQLAAASLLTDQPFLRVDNSTTVASVLGKGQPNVIYDCHHQFDPDMFGAISGTVIGGGCLLLLTPPLADWPKHCDALHERVLVHGHELALIAGNFILRLVKLIESDNQVVCIRQPDLPAPLNSPVEVSTRDFSLTADQLAAYQLLLHGLNGHRRRPVVLTADRGRGKSTVLGMIATQALKDGKRRVLVTASNRTGVATLLDHAASLLGEEVSKNSVQGQGGLIQFVPPDELIRRALPADLLLVDEAAGIALPMLGILLEKYARVAFATTLHGYEGSGRGFKLRFEQTLDRLAPKWKSVQLKQPVRWDAGDPLEDFVFRALLLDAEVVDIDTGVGFALEDIIIQLVDKNMLLADGALLRQVFALLVNAHYQTRPFDLLNILDGPNIQLRLAYLKNKPIAAVWVADEGELDADLIDDIALGKRRPRGHLLPQTLIAQAGFPQLGRCRFQRIVRIAVHPLLQGKGIGGLLLDGVFNMAKQQGVDFIGSSFGATEKLMGFWQGHGFSPVRLGMLRDASSGAHSVLLLKTVKNTVQPLLQQLEQRFQQQFPVLLTEPLADLEPELVALFIVSCNPLNVLSELDKNDLNSFAEGNRQYADCLFALEKFAIRVLAANVLTRTDADLLIYKILQHKSWSEVVVLTGLTGKKQIVRQLREVVTRNLLAVC